LSIPEGAFVTMSPCQLSQFTVRACLAGFVLLTSAGAADAQVVPGTGTLLNTDDFEAENWLYVWNLPKSSKEEDEQIRYPLGQSTNGLWFESPKRGQPDAIRRIETPEGGIPGSKGSLYLRSRDTGIPGRPGVRQVQDDLILAARPISIGYSPSFVVRVYFPEWEEWEQRTGVSFGIRAGLQGPSQEVVPASFGKRLFGRRTEVITKQEPFYPGFFIQFNSSKQNPQQFQQDHAVLLLRANELGHDIPSKKIEQTGWWTFGMSITPDSRCHYYAKPGVEDLTAADYITSTFPYRIPAHYFNTIFFNVCSIDNGQTWSTPWIIDDPKIFYGGGQQRVQQVAQPAQQMQR
jgi:hypothetical protein